MNFLKKLFGKQSNNPASVEKDPENTRLIYLLDIWAKHSSQANYEAVYNEILYGNCFLLIPSGDNAHIPSESGWKRLETGTKLELQIFDKDGLKILGVFTDEYSMSKFIKNPTQYVAMSSKDLIEFCQQHSIGRIVINSDQANMFVLERNREHISSIQIEEETQVLIGTPSQPLESRILEKLKSEFKKVETIEEAYQVAQSMQQNVSIVLGIKMAVISENSRVALQNAVSNAIAEEQLNLPLDVMILSDDWLETMRGIEDSLFYKK